MPEESAFFLQYTVFADLESHSKSCHAPTPRGVLLFMSAHTRTTEDAVLHSSLAVASM